MRTADDAEDPGAGFGSVAEALRAGRAVADYLNSPAARELDGAACGEALIEIGAIQSGLAAAQGALLRRFDADSAHDADGYASTAAWLAGRTGLGRKDAKAAVRRMRLLARHPHLDAATTTGALTISWAKEIAGWTGRIDHEELQAEADQILVDAATAGADLDDLKLIAQAAYEAWRAQEPDPDDDPRGRRFGDRHLILDTTLDGAGHVRGDLTPSAPPPSPPSSRPSASPAAPTTSAPPASAATTPSRRAASSSSGPRWSPTGPEPTPASTSPSPSAISWGWTGRRSSRTPGSAPAPASTGTYRARMPRPSPATP
jgi:hypothetical protein